MKAQEVHEVTTLDKKMSETSGLMIYEGGFYTFNDSGGDPAIYEIDTNTGEVSREIPVANAKNVDWEAIARDDHYLYIGDIGNNKGNRKNLVIYKCPLEGFDQGSFKAESIKISYADQLDFEHEAHHHRYDAEALFVKNDQLYLVSKNWVQNESTVYEVPTVPGEYVLDPLYAFSTAGKVTDADFNKGSDEFYLIGYGDFPFISIIQGNSLKDWSWRLVVPVNSLNAYQTEGIQHLGNDLYYTCEQVKILKAELGYYHLRELRELCEIKVSNQKIKMTAAQKISKVKLISSDGQKELWNEKVKKKNFSIPLRSIVEHNGEVIVIVELKGKGWLEKRITLN